MIALISCGEPEPIIVVDGWWNVDFARNACKTAANELKDKADEINLFGCKESTNCPANRAVIEACQPDPGKDVAQFQTAMMNALKSDPRCNGIRILYYDHPKTVNKEVVYAMDRKYNALLLNFVPGREKQSWSLNPQESWPIAKGEDDPIAIAQKACMAIRMKAAPIVPKVIK